MLMTSKKERAISMKKLLTLTAAALMCLSLLTAVPHAQAYEDTVPEYTEETVPETAGPMDIPDYADDNL